MSDTVWLAIAITAGALFAWGWIKREQWIHHRRTSKRDQARTK
jgi:hypothetical protein